jgi:hypothetical protein
MLSQHRQMQLMIQQYKDEHGVSVWDMNDVAEYASKHGWQLPTPLTPMQLLAKKFSQAAREETREDKETGDEYRVNHAISDYAKGTQRTLWGDIDAVPRAFMHKSFTQRRQQVVGDVVHLATDVDHWNRTNPEQDPLQVEFDFRRDIEWRKNAPDEDEGAA